jgi:hypothetical protein
LKRVLELAFRSWIRCQALLAATQYDSTNNTHERDTNERNNPLYPGLDRIDTKLQPNHRDTKKMTEILKRQTGVLTAY